MLDSGMRPGHHSHPDNTMPKGDEIVATLLTRRITKVFEVVVTVPRSTLVPEGELIPCDTTVLLTEVGYIQLTTGLDPLASTARLLKGVSDIQLVGDYDDRLSVALREIVLSELPVTVSAVYTVCESIGMSEEQSFVGVFIEDESGKIALGIQMHADDAVIGGADLLWDYIRKLMPRVSKVVLMRNPPTRQRV